jgi:hypothetical protein
MKINEKKFSFRRNDWKEVRGHPVTGIRYSLFINRYIVCKGAKSAAEND